MIRCPGRRWPDLYSQFSGSPGAASPSFLSHYDRMISRIRDSSLRTLAGCRPDRTGKPDAGGPQPMPEESSILVRIRVLSSFTEETFPVSGVWIKAPFGTSI